MRGAAPEENPDRKVKLILIGMSVLIVIIAGILLIIFEQGYNPQISVNFSGYRGETNGNRIAAFALKNTGNVTILIKQDCVLSWTLPGGATTNQFYRLGTNLTLPLNDSKAIALPFPTNATSFYASFGYAKEENFMDQVVQYLRRLSNEKITISSTFVLSPTVTLNPDMFAFMRTTFHEIEQAFPDLTLLNAQTGTSLPATTWHGTANGQAAFVLQNYRRYHSANAFSPNTPIVDIFLFIAQYPSASEARDAVENSLHTRAVMPDTAVAFCHQP